MYVHVGYHDVDFGLTQPFAQVRAIHEFDLPAFPVHTFVFAQTMSTRVSYYSRYNGAAKLPAYVPHAHAGPLPSVAEGEKVYTGSCHCGNITVALAAEDVAKLMVVECDCSICLRVRSKFSDPRYNSLIFSFRTVTEVCTWTPARQSYTPQTPASRSSTNSV
jgi:hypothetical protein